MGRKTLKLLHRHMDLFAYARPSPCSLICRSCSPRCTDHWTPPPGLWGSLSRRWSGSEPRHSWWTGWCAPRSSPHQWCAPAACFPLPGGRPGSHRLHGSRWLQAPKLLFLPRKKKKKGTQVGVWVEVYIFFFLFFVKKKEKKVVFQTRWCPRAEGRLRYMDVAYTCDLYTVFLPQAKFTEVCYWFDFCSKTPIDQTATCISGFIHALAVNAALCGSTQSEILAWEKYFFEGVFLTDDGNTKASCSAGKPKPFKHFSSQHRFEDQRFLLWCTFF